MAGSGPHDGIQLFDGSVDNAGLIAIEGTGPNDAMHVGIYITQGSVLNEATGTINGGYGFGVTLRFATTPVYNAGLISGGYVGVLADFGSVTNVAGGNISSANGVGVGINQLIAPIYNAGTIVGTRGGVYIDGSGAVTNVAGGYISGGGGDGVHLGNYGGVENAGTIRSSFGNAVSLYGGHVINEAGGTMTGATGVQIFGARGYLDNAGTITGASAGAEIFTTGDVINSGLISTTGTTTGSYGVNLEYAGSVTNTATGTITTAGTAVLMNGLQSSFYNAGVISGAVGVYAAGGSFTNASGGEITGVGDGLFLRNQSSLDNAGTISGEVRGVYLASGGSITNEAGGLISASTGYGVQIGGPGTLTNAGSITCDAVGVALEQGGTVINEAGGYISGAPYGVFISGVTGTLVNDGTIAGGVFLASIGGDRLVLGGGSSISGQVSGPGSYASHTLELSASHGAGTLHGLGSQYLGFGTVTIDHGATWTIDSSIFALATTTVTGFTIRDTLELSGGGTLAAAEASAGTLVLDGAAGFTLSNGATLREHTIIVDAGASLAATGALKAAISDQGTLTASAGTLTLAGRLTGDGTVGAASGAVLDVTKGFNWSGSVTGDTVRFTSVGTLSAGASLSAANVVERQNLVLGAGETLTNAAGNSFTMTPSGKAATLSGPGTFTNAGTFATGNMGRDVISAAFLNSGRVSAGGGTLAFMGATTNTGTMVVAHATLKVAGALQGTGTVNILDNGKLELLGGASAGETINFLGTTGMVLDLGDPAGFLGHVHGFGAGDTIDLLHTHASTLSFSGNTLTVLEHGTTVASLIFEGQYSAANFSLSGDLQGGALISFKS